MTAADQLASYLGGLFAHAPAGSLIELRFRTANGMGRIFHDADQVLAVAAAVNDLAPRTDVYVGTIPRRRHAGGRADLVPRARVVWIDCDSADCAERLRDFSPTPSLILSSGSEWHQHAYWVLAAATDIDTIEQTNRRLAATLGADPTSADAARILRPAASLNHKHDPPAAVQLERCTAAAHHLQDLTTQLTSVDEAPHRLPTAPRTTEDPLHSIAPALYVERLTGQTVSRQSKIHCPFHDDRTPSLHVYDDPERGWYCYGCRRGGSAYDFAALLWLTGHSPVAGGRRPLRGREFLQVRERLLAMFFGEGKAA